jgi:hypothetical protein
MANMKNLILDIEEMLLQGVWPAEIAKRTGADMKTILQVEDDVYILSDSHNIGHDYD